VVEASPWLEDNHWLLALAGEYPVIVGIVGNLSPGSSGFAQHLARFAKYPLFRGIRLGAQALARGLGTSGFDDDARRLADAGLSMDLLGGAAMLGDVVRLAGVAPQLPVVIDHLPFADWDADAPGARRALRGLADLPNVYAKVSGVLRPAGTTQAATAQYASRMDLLWEIFGDRRVLYGSNWPVSNRLAPYQAVHRVVSDYVQARGRAVAESFFWRNSLAVYRWVWRGAMPFPGDRP
jgi:predicted TIM-barrel fold metal-dependent hydrolase